MRFLPSLQLRRVCFALCLAALAGCERSTALDAAAPPSTEHSGSDDDSDVDGVEDLELKVGASSLEPGASTTVTVRVSPRRVVDVQLALVDGTDAFLENAALKTNEGGVATTRLTVVSRTQQSLELLARTGKREARTKITIREPSFADVAIVPLYAGARSFAAWDILVDPDLTCDVGYDADEWESATRFPVETSADAGAPAYDLADVSASRPLTVLVKAERYAYGCVSGVGLTPKTLNRVEVPMNQRFADISKLSLALQMNIASNSEFWVSLLGPRDTGAYLGRLVSAFRGDEASDLAALLQAMGDLPENPNAEAFSAARQTAGWDEVLATRLSPEGAQSGLSSRVQRWLQAGASLLQEPDSLTAQLAFDSAANRAELHLTSVAGLCPEECFMSSSVGASVAVDTQDVLRVGFELFFLPSPLLTCLADRAVASGADAGGGDVLSALSADFDCNLVATWMADEFGDLFEGCDVNCGADLCHAALAQLWRRVVEADPSTAKMAVNAAGSSTLSPDAAVVGVTAEWVGTTSFMGEETSVAGRMSSVEDTIEACD